MNDDDKQGSGTDDSELELHVPYALSDLIVQTKPNHHFSIGSTHTLPPMITKISTTQENTEVLTLV